MEYSKLKLTYTVLTEYLYILGKQWHDCSECRDNMTKDNRCRVQHMSIVSITKGNEYGRVAIKIIETSYGIECDAPLYP